MIYDPSQISVIEAQQGYHLVLAPPGCGKTQILAERIRQAHRLGVAYDDMLCLTFTNRAARGMRERIRQHVGDREVERIYVGNVHRYCSKFLFDNSLIPAETAVIDDDDAISIIANYLQEDEYYIAANFNRRKEYFAAIHLSAMMYQIEHGHPRELRLHPECLCADDVHALRTICERQRMEFTPQAMADIYHHVSFYRSSSQTDGYDYADRQIVSPLLRKMEVAHYYSVYKQENNLVDFEDLLLKTYDVVSAVGSSHKRYPWIQVDEVQDLNPLQLRIVDLLTASGGQEDRVSVMYLGDEQQAIFSFMGAKMTTLQQLKQRCGDNVHTLAVNHRSPDYLLRVFNTYAEKVLQISPELLPVTNVSPQRVGNELAIIPSSTLDVEYRDVAQQAERLYRQNPDETTAVIVTSNADADIIGNIMTEQFRLPHFKVSGTDLFSTPEMKLLLSHLEIHANEHNFIAWSRLLKGLRVYEQNAAARSFVRQMKDVAMLPSDLLVYERSSYVMEFIKVYEGRDVVVFDTETTGLDVYEDDILQIAALKIRNGVVVPGSEFKVFIATDREIPLMLGDIPNPIIEEMKVNVLMEHGEALRRFVEYVGDGVLLGHNADYDYNILKHNLLRYLPEVDFAVRFPVYFDSLKLSRLLMPELHQYKLKHLLDVLHLEGENSHLADADVDATKNVVVYCYDRAKEMEPLQREFLASKTTKDRAAVLRRNYKDIYDDVCRRLWNPVSGVDGGCSLLTKELASFHDYLVEGRFLMGEIRNLEHVFAYIDNELIGVADAVGEGRDKEQSLKSQISAHSLEISTLKEADLCGSKSMTEKVFVTTVHKAKGLEFDNVIVFDAVEGRYPNFFNQNNPQMVAEDARKFYVAMTRAKRRLYVSMAATKITRYRQPLDQKLTRFMNPLLNQFSSLPEEENKG